MKAAVRKGEPGIQIFNLWNLRRVDPIVAALVIILAVYGICVLYSAGRSVYSPTPHYIKQSAFFLIGWMIALFISCVDYRVLVSLAPLAYGVILCLLVAVLVVGEEIKGSRRWLDLGPIGFQPSESTKIVMVFMMAWYLTIVGRRIEKLPYFLLTFAVAGVPALLIFKQPDLGTAGVLVPISGAMLFAAGCRIRHLVGLATLGLVALPFAWTHLKPYQKQRVMTLIDPSADPQGSGYHTIQSQITVGSGGLTGKGYLNGTQTYLRYLPEHHTDFIYSQLAEEFGFVGACLALVLFLCLFWRILHIARTAADPAGSLLAVGCTALLGFHVFVNTSITIGILPVTGIPLPFFSYGGTFCLTTMACMGIILSVNARRSLPGHSARPIVLQPSRQGIL
jgi:rod shape determining protein RodA